MGKRIISIFLVLVFCLSFSVVSFGATPTQGVTVSNFPEWFTGIHDASIASDLMFVRAHCANIAGYLELIEPDINDINANVAGISSLASVQNGILSDFKLLFNNFYTAFENIILNNYDDYHMETIGAIGGVTSAVNRVNGSVNSFNQDFTYETDINNQYSLGYSLHMLQQVLADEKDLTNKRKLDNASDTGFNFLTNPNNTLSLNATALSDSLHMGNFLVDMFGFGGSYDEIYSIFNTGNNLWGWFTQSTKDNIYGVVSPVVYDSRSLTGVTNVEEPAIVTDYYNQNMNQVLSFFGRGDDK